MTVQRGDIISFSDFWSFGIDDQARRAAGDSAVLREALEILKDIFESNNYDIYIYFDVDIEEADMTDILENWIFQENMKLIFYMNR